MDSATSVQCVPKLSGSGFGSASHREKTRTNFQGEHPRILTWHLDLVPSVLFRMLEVQSSILLVYLGPSPVRLLCLLGVIPILVLHRSTPFQWYAGICQISPDIFPGIEMWSRAPSWNGDKKVKAGSPPLCSSIVRSSWMVQELQTWLGK